MDDQEKIELAERNIRQAIADYGAHTNQTDVLENVSDYFIERLAKDSYYAKQELRELFRKSPVWDEKLDALVINGTRTHDPDPNRIRDLAERILFNELYRYDCGDARREKIDRAICFFSATKASSEDKQQFIDAIKELAPKAYAPNKKPSRIFKALCEALGVADDTKGSDFQRLFAQFADELTTRKIGFKLFVSINPAHFVTMSNPKGDRRGETLTSCHSFNSTDYDYNNGCTGYARDNYTFIVFTVADPSNPEALNNRKTTRQIFAYKPDNGLLLQSRLYNTSGGTHGAQEESKLYRDLMQRELSALEEQPNLWTTFRYYNNAHGVHFASGDDFGGYPDWTYDDFDARVSIRVDHAEDYEEFDIGTIGICAACGTKTDNGVYCRSCEDDFDGRDACDCCGERFDDSDLYSVRDSRGNTVYVCESCRDRHYTQCYHCDEYYPDDDMTRDIDGDSVCPTCFEERYGECDYCEEWVNARNLYNAIRGRRQVRVCEYCRDRHYTECEECGEHVYEDDMRVACDADGCAIDICEHCAEEHYSPCEECGDLYRNDVLENGLCPECAAKIANDDEPENTGMEESA